MAFLLSIFNAFLYFRMMSYLSEEFPHIERLFYAFVFEVIVEYARQLYTVHDYQHYAGKKRDVEFLPENLPYHSGQCYPTYIIYQFIDRPAPFPGRSDGFATFACRQDAEP